MVFLSNDQEVVIEKGKYLVPGMTDSSVSLNGDWQSQVDGGSHEDLCHWQHHCHNGEVGKSLTNNERG